jgi:hypothetical protein
MLKIRSVAKKKQGAEKKPPHLKLPLSQICYFLLFAGGLLLEHKPRSLMGEKKYQQMSFGGKI